MPLDRHEKAVVKAIREAIEHKPGRYLSLPDLDSRMLLEMIDKLEEENANVHQALAECQKAAVNRI